MYGGSVKTTPFFIRDIGTGVQRGHAPHFLANYAKVPLPNPKCPSQVHNIITFSLTLITFILKGIFGILFFHSTFEIFYMN